MFLEKSTKTAATRAALFDSNMRQIVCRLGLRPLASGGAYSVPQTFYLYLEGPTSKWRGEERKESEGNGEEMTEEEERKGSSSFARKKKKEMWEPMKQLGLQINRS